MGMSASSWRGFTARLAPVDIDSPDAFVNARGMATSTTTRQSMSLLRMRGAWGGGSAELYNAVVARGVRPIYDELLGQTVARFPVPQGARILDVGCGPGHATAALAQKLPSARIVGVDLADRAIALARAAYGERSNASFQVADAMSLPFADAAFDVVMSTASIKHWPSAERGVREALRVLRRGGSLVLLETDPACTNEQALRFVSYFQHVPALAGNFVGWYFRRFVAQQSPSVERIARWVEDAGAELSCAESLSTFPLSMVVAKKPVGS
jgi:ubiquinone/menaquinone biosynthesis C-methylase UbiE